MPGAEEEESVGVGGSVMDALSCVGAPEVSEAACSRDQWLEAGTCEFAVGSDDGAP
jgi:hypothetical protein